MFSITQLKKVLKRPHSFISIKTSFMSNRPLCPQLSVLKCIYCGLAQPERDMDGGESPWD